MQKIITALRGLLVRVRGALGRLWRTFRALARWAQALVIAVILALLVGLSMLLGGAKPDASAGAERTVTLRSVAELSGNAAGDSVIGTVRSRSEAEILAEAGGTVRRVNSTVGASVGAGAIIAELDNDSERAAVLQAEGAYDAAVASRAGVSPVDVDTAARNAYRSAFSTLDTVLETDVDAFFGAYTATGPRVLLAHLQTDPANLSRARVAIEGQMASWRSDLASADSRNAASLLTQAEAVARSVQSLIEQLAVSANDSGSGVTDAQVAALSAARSGVAGVLASLNAARASERSGSVGSTASVDAGVKSALGTLRLAQANLERTIVRAPIAGTVNFLPIRVGDYVTNLMHVATVAQNGALEIVAYVSEETRAGLEVAGKVTLEGAYPGAITSIAPALDPITKQIEVHVAADSATGLVNGQSVRITLPGVSSATTTASAGPILLPLSAVKLSAGSRVVFTIGENGRLAALPVEIGEVRGERIEIRSPLSPDTRIVEDARGLADGQQVKIAGAE